MSQRFARMRPTKAVRSGFAIVADVPLPIAAEDMVMETEIVARAYQLAPDCSHLEELRIKLKREGYSNVDGHFSSRQLKGELAKRLTHQEA